MAVSIPLGTTFAKLPFPGTSTFTDMQSYTYMDQDISDSWAKGVLSNLLSVNAIANRIPLTNLKIVFPNKMNINKNTLEEVLELYKKTELLTHNKMDPSIQTAFFEQLVFEDERTYFEITDQFFQVLSESGQMRLYVENKKLIDYIIGITTMMKKQDSLIEEFYTMSADYLRTGKTTPTNMLQNILKNIEKLHKTPDARIFINKINFLAINIDNNLKNFNHLVSITDIDILDTIKECFVQEL